MNEVKPVVFDNENPEWTDSDFANAKLASQILPKSAVDVLVRKRGRPVLDVDERKQKVNIRLSPDVLAALRSGGAGWQTRADDILRKALHLGKSG